MEKLRIAICDDEISWHENATVIIKNYAEKISAEIELVYFYDSDSLLNYEGLPLDCVLMDIELNDENGINAVIGVNKKWNECSVVYVTNYLFYATDSYSTDHIYFVLKEKFEEKIGSVFEKNISC